MNPATHRPGFPPCGYPPIGDYAAIGDCRTVALISRSGSIDWLCLPHFSGPALFAALLDRRRGGSFAIRPLEPFDSQRHYRQDSNVLETEFITARGRVRVTDCMPVLAGSPLERTLQPQREVLRVIEGLEGQVELEVRYDPRPDFARGRYRLRRRGSLGWACQYRDQFYLLHTDLPLEGLEEGGVGATRTVVPGQRHYLSLGYTCRDVAAIAPLGTEADTRLEATLAWWRDWGVACRYQGPYREAVVRSALTLKLMTYSLSGAVVAAPTTSLPEWIGGGRNWDYRYCWLRDAALILEAFMELGYRHEAAAFLDWLLHATRLTWPRLKVLYDVYGEVHLPEQELGHLEGYRHSRPVRLGNDAREQLQLDVYGAVIHAALGFIRLGGRLGRAEARVLEGFGRTVRRCWREPDEGIWEIRGARRHHTYSKLMCWAALECLLKLDQAGQVGIDRAGYQRDRDAIRATIEEEAFHPGLNGYVGHFGGETADAALLLMSRCSYLPADHPRMVGTWELIRRTLDRDGLLLRYPPESDGLAGDEGAFGIVSFWAVDYLARAGRVTEARQRFEKLLTLGNDLGLYPEEWHPQTGQALGNFPQAFTHVGLISAALSLCRAGVGHLEDG
ncbi:MAG: glycoside hydrolase family 15 protein [Candidatus Competibacteraceae bacterium]|nr:glycoside hydrolase family 15 protein [Candidatus Competibacteraceae bacterium]